MAPPPDYDKDETFSERTYHDNNTPYNIELNQLRSNIPNAQTTRPRSMEYGYNPRYDGINEAPASGSSKGMKRAQKVFATMCCGSCLCFALWIILSLLVIAVFAVLLVKVAVSDTILCAWFPLLTRKAPSYYYIANPQCNFRCLFGSEHRHRYPKHAVDFLGHDNSVFRLDRNHDVH